jgi:hypothetical protein
MNWSLLQRRVQAVGQTVTHIEPSAPDKQDFTNDLLHAADVLEGVKAHIEQMVDSLHYFADLGSGEASRDFVKVRQQLANTRTLISSSPLVLVKVKELAITLQAVVTEEGTRRTNTAKQPAARSNAGRSWKDKNERQEVDIVPSEIDSTRVPPKSPNQPTSGLIPKVQHDQERVSVVLSEIEELLGKPKFNTQPMVHVDAAPMRKSDNEQKTVMIPAEIERHLEKPKTGDRPAVPLSLPPMQNEQQKANDPFSEEVEALLGKDWGFLLESIPGKSS